jgi:hypothetical protein
MSSPGRNNAVRSGKERSGRGLNVARAGSGAAGIYNAGSSGAAPCGSDRIALVRSGRNRGDWRRLVCSSRPG